MRSSVNELHSGESGFDSNWTFLHSKLEFEEQIYIGSVNQVASLRCSILPKSLLQMHNGDLLVASYAACGIHVRAYQTSPAFRKISKRDFELTSIDYENMHRHKRYCYARE